MTCQLENDMSCDGAPVDSIVREHLATLHHVTILSFNSLEGPSGKSVSFPQKENSDRQVSFLFYFPECQESHFPVTFLFCPCLFCLQAGMNRIGRTIFEKLWKHGETISSSVCSFFHTSSEMLIDFRAAQILRHVLLAVRRVHFQSACGFETPNTCTHVKRLGPTTNPTHSVKSFSLPGRGTKLTEKPHSDFGGLRFLSTIFTQASFFLIVSIVAPVGSYLLILATCTLRRTEPLSIILHRTNLVSTGLHMW